MEVHVVRERFYDREMGYYQSYGLVARGGEGDLWYIPDISTEEWRVRRLAEQIQRLELSPLHLMDVVMDSLE